MVIFQNIWFGVQPSSSAASYRVGSTPMMAAISMMVVLPNHIRKFIRPISPRLPPDGVQEAERLLQDAHADQHRIDGAVVREEGKKQHGEGRGHDQVRHIDDRLEEGLALQLQAKIGEPRRQQQGRLRSAG